MPPKRQREPLEKTIQQGNSVDDVAQPARKKQQRQVETFSNGAGPSRGPPPQRQPRQNNLLPLQRPSVNSSSSSSSSSSSDSSSSDSDSSSSEDEDDEDDATKSQQLPPKEEEQQYFRIRSFNASGQRRFRALIPPTTNPFQKIKNKTPYVPFGATFVTAIDAARAADVALIAMWGPTAAEPLLNFPLDSYTAAQRQQLFGNSLSSFLLSLCEQAKAQRAKAVFETGVAKRDAGVSQLSKWEEEAKERRSKIHRLKRTKLIDETKRCGVCPACRRPWLKEVCYRRQRARQVGYNSTKVAEAMLNDDDDESSGDDDGDSSSSSSDDEDDDDEVLVEGEEIHVAGDKNKLENGGGDGDITRRKPKKHQNQKEKTKTDEYELKWYAKPTGTKGAAAAAAARDRHRFLHLESLHTRAESTALEEAAAEAAALTTALTASLPAGHSTAPPPKNIIPPPPHAALLRHALDCAALGTDLSLFDDEDPRFSKAIGPQGQLNQCNLCYGWHAASHPEQCPVIQAAYAVPISRQQQQQQQRCPHCADAAVPGCKKCVRKSLPVGVWTPAVMPVGSWMDESIQPGVSEIMGSVQSVASAAVVDFDRPEVAAKLGPHALLAMGLLAKELVTAQLKI